MSVLTISQRLQMLIESLASKLGRSIAVVDTSVLPIYTSRHFGDEDSVRVRAVLQRDAGTEARQFVLAQGIAHWPTAGMLEGNSDLGLHPRFVAPLRGGNTLLGYLIVIDADRSLAATDIESIEEISQEVSTQLQIDTMTADAEYIEQQTEVRKLLGTDGEARQSAIAALRRRSFAEVAEYTAVTIIVATDHTLDGIPVEPALHACVDNIVRTRRATCASDVNGDRAVLLQLGDRPFGAAELRKQAASIGVELDRLRGVTSGFRIGVGTDDSGLPGAWIARHRAEIAIRAGTRGVEEREGITVWSDLGINSLLLQLPEECFEWSALPEPTRALVDLDGSGKLVRTARCFLDEGGSISRTAAAMHLHRTSLYYRLDQITRITGLDLDNGRDRLTLHLGLYLLDLMRGTPGGDRTDRRKG